MIVLLRIVLLSISVCTVPARQDVNRYQALPTLDVKTCGPTPKCDNQTKFRTMDGSCSNLEHPAWGQSDTPYIRTRKANYYDGKSQVRRAVNGSLLPEVRPLSAALFPDKNVPDEIYNVNVMQFGQMTTHDVTQLRIRVLEEIDMSCCNNNKKVFPLPKVPDACLPIDVPSTDDFYHQFNLTCLDYVRAAASNCHESPIQQENIMTHVWDASFLYGNNKFTANNLRAFKEGKMMVQTINGKPFPPQFHNAGAACQNPPSEHVCFYAGDFGVNFNPGMTVYHILLVRLHNILCDRLSKINPHWDDERLYQEVRKIIGTILQHVNYKHFLPIIVGKDFMVKKGMPADDCYDCCRSYYDPDVNPSTYTEFAGAIYRTFHSLIPRENLIYKTENETKDYILLEDYLFRPTITTVELDGLLRGLVNQPQQTQDRYITVGLTHYLMKGHKAFGGDLEAVELQRGRDLGLPTYNEMRETCGYKRAKNFDDLDAFMSKDTIELLKSHYVNVDDVDLFTGAVMEDLVPGTLSGPVTQCVVGEQFYHYQRGDRFYYENCGLPTSFTKEQRNAIYKTTLAWLFCEGSDKIKFIQKNTFLKPSQDNPLVSCDKIPGLDLSPWKEKKP